MTLLSNVVASRSKLYTQREEKRVSGERSMQPLSLLNLFQLRETHLEPFFPKPFSNSVSQEEPFYFLYLFHPLDTYTVHTLMLYFLLLMFG